MEDLTITPWENQDPKTLFNFYSTKSKQSTKRQESLSIKNRQIQTESNDMPTLCFQKKKYFIQKFRQKGQSTSIHQSFYQRKQINSPSKLQIKLVSYPIQQKCKQRQIGGRFSDKLEIKQKLNNQSFEVIQTIYNSQSNKVKVFKQRPLFKNYSANETILNKKLLMKRQSKNNPYLKEFRGKSRQMNVNMSTQNKLLKPLSITTNIKNKLQIQTKQNIYNQNPLIKKKSISRQKYQQYFKQNLSNKKIQHQNLDQDKIIDQNRSIRYSQSKRNDLQANEMKQIKKQRKLSVQKLSNINCFKQTTNIFTNLKKKNKNLFNQLEKYNLFGLRNQKNKILLNQH